MADIENMLAIFCGLDIEKERGKMREIGVAIGLAVMTMIALACKAVLLTALAGLTAN